MSNSVYFVVRDLGRDINGERRYEYVNEYCVEYQAVEACTALNAEQDYTATIFEPNINSKIAYVVEVPIAYYREALKELKHE